MEDRYPELRSFCLVVGADAEVVETVRSLLDAHPAALVTRDLDLFKEGTVRFEKRARLLDAISARRPGDDADGHHVIGVTAGGNATEALRELHDLVGVPVKVVNTTRDPFDETALIAGAGTPRKRLRAVRARHEALMLVEQDGGEILHVRLEDLGRDLPGELARLCRFLGLEPAPGHLEAARPLAAGETGPARERMALTDKEVRQVNDMIDRFPWLHPYRGTDRSERKGKRGTLSAFTEYFFDAAGPSDAPVLLFHHIQKTAGTSLREMIRANLPQAERETRRHDHFLPMDVLLEAFAGDLEEVPLARRAALRCVMSHRANFALPFIDRPVEAITILREPVDRVVSHHWFTRFRGEPLSATWALEAIYADGGSSSQFPPKAGSTHYNFQARSLLAPYHDPAGLARTRGPGPDADLWRERLFTVVSERYTVGIKERLEDFVAELANRFGWEHTTLAHKKASSGARRRPATSDLPEGLQEEIRAYNWLDVELYQHCST